MRFCHDFALTLFPVNESILCYFVACLGLSAATIKTYLSGVLQIQIAAGQLFPCLRQVTRGVELTRSVRGNQMRTQLPITPSILRKLRGSWWGQGSQSTRSMYDRSLLWAVALIAFFGFCRSGELTMPRERPLSSLITQKCGLQQPTASNGSVRRTKMDQARHGVKIVLGVTRRDLCPVQALLEYLSLRGREPRPLFLWSDGKPVTKTRLVEEVRLALRGAGLPGKEFAGHSFRIGAAMTASAAGVDDSTIQALGCWKTSAISGQAPSR